MQVLKEYTFLGRGKRSAYDWATLLDGRIHELTKGEDFACTAASFRNSARAAALKQDQRLRTAVVGDKVVIQSYTAAEAVTDE